MSAVALDRVAKRYDETRWALDDVSLTAAPGECLVLLGPSGCGKTTLLRCIAGLEEPSRGTITVGARLVNGLPPAERDVAMVFQNYALYPHLTVRENIAFPLAMRRVAPAERSQRVAAVAEALGLSDLLERRPGQLSGGERQRTALARAIVRQPKAFLFDEPLSNLDAALRAGMRAELAALHRRLGVTALYVTHDQTEAMTLGHRIAILRAGRLEQVGTPAEVYARPATVFVATFVGNPGMNVLGVEAWRRGGVELGPGAASAGFRPEDARLGGPDGTGLRGRVTLVEPLGAETLVHVRLDGGESVVARVRQGRMPALDEPVCVGVDVARLRRFDADGLWCA